jgi:hypothetical protein
MASSTAKRLFLTKKKTGRRESGKEQAARFPPAVRHFQVDTPSKAEYNTIIKPSFQIGIILFNV